MNSYDRRRFIKQATGTVAAVTGSSLAGKSFAQTEPAPAAPAVQDQNVASKIRVACIGIFGRGKNHIDSMVGRDGVELVAICDADNSTLSARQREIEKKTGKPVKTYDDMRRIFDDKDIDAVTFATPNHWHALGTIWACQAGKDVYVEKPASHNVWEGRQMIKAARKYNRIVQVGTQSRSSAALREAVQKLRDGAIGEVYMAKGLCYKWRGTIGKVEPTTPPTSLNYELWTGPADMLPYTKHRHPYNWHWYWNYGNGDIGNQGVHEMDKARWGLGVGMPTEIQAMGNKFMFDDSQETPNTMIATFNYPDQKKMLVFEVRHWMTNPELGEGERGENNVGNIFYGSEGYMVMPDYSTYEIFLGKKAESQGKVSKGGDHFGNFFDAVRSRKIEDLNCDIEEGHPSAALCHLANISYRLKRTLNFDPASEKFVNDAEADKMLTRPYRPGFEIPAEV